MKRALAIFCFCAAASYGADSKLGIFEAHADVGETPKKGSAEFDASTGEYRVTGGGANIWTTVDAFQFVSKQMSGDMAFTADVLFMGTGAVQHRKAALMIRQSPDPGSAYADVALHGDGLTSLQYRPEAGALTKEIRSDLKAPVRIRLERRGNEFTMFAGNPGEELKPAGPVTVALQDPVYVGLGVSSHNADVLETAIFANVKIESLAKERNASARQAMSPARPQSRSKISIYTLKDKSTEVIYTADKIFEAPNWSPDGKYLLVNRAGASGACRLAPNPSNPRRSTLARSPAAITTTGFRPTARRLQSPRTRGDQRRKCSWLRPMGRTPIS